MPAAAGTGAGPRVGSCRCLVRAGLCFCGTQPSLGTMSLGVMLTGTHPLLFSLSDGPGVKEHRLRTWGHMFI